MGLGGQAATRGIRDIKKKFEFCGYMLKARGRAVIIPVWSLPHM